MPIPKPKDKEDEKSFMSRCMGDENMKEYKGDQRSTICMKSFKANGKDIGLQSNSHIQEGQKVNFALPTRQEMFESKRHLVVPVVLMAEGVHNGVYYSSEELSKYPQSWNGIPVPIFHPSEKGENVSANSPNVLEKTVGRLFNVNFSEGKLKGELWIDVEKAQKLSPELLAKINAKQQIEVSTGLWGDTVEEEGNWNGEKYGQVLINYRPDHLAILLGTEGACSWKDGCGIRANATNVDELVKNLKVKNGEFVGMFVENDTMYKEVISKISKMLDDMMVEKMKKVMAEMGLPEGSMPNSYVYLVDLTKEYCVYQNPEGQMMKQYYKINDKGEISFEGNPVKVIEKKEYIEINQKKEVDVEKEKREKVDEKENLININNGGNKKMPSEQRIKDVTAILANVKMPFVAEQKGFLEEMSDVNFAKVLELNEKVKTCKSCNGIPEEPKVAPKTAEEFIANAPIEIQKLLNGGLRMQGEQKDEYVKAIMANKRNKFTEAQLKSRDLDELELMSALADVEENLDFSGRGGAPAINVDKDGRQQDGKGVPAIPKMEWSKK
jgi:hypothetical protein